MSGVTAQQGSSINAYSPDRRRNKEVSCSAIKQKLVSVMIRMDCCCSILKEIEREMRVEDEGSERSRWTEKHTRRHRVWLRADLIRSDKIRSDKMR
jgi:hypothetical protein